MYERRKMKKIKTLTVCQPWASAIMADLRNVENMTWMTKHRGILLIHAAKSKKLFDLNAPENKIYPVFHPLRFSGQLPFGAILGTVDLIDIIEYHEIVKDLFPFASGPYCWVLDNPRKLKEPIPWRGHRGLWKVPGELVKEVI